MNNDTVAVADLLPFWRYAVGPTSQNSPAIPFYQLTEAKEFFEKAKHDLPWSGCKLYQRTWRGVVTLQEYKPVFTAGDTITIREASRVTATGYKDGTIQGEIKPP